MRFLRSIQLRRPGGEKLDRSIDEGEPELYCILPAQDGHPLRLEQRALPRVAWMPTSTPCRPCRARAPGAACG
ncbi:hypothetical protein UMZ34_07035 [Halopseudomonas pachastrellae]|nr:hypothetical protein UMZ34_07035 [Halopseudomonas pachastrellae]